MALTPALTRIKNNQITDNTIIASSKVVPRTVTGGLLSDPLTYSGNVSITGNLSVQGTTTTIDTVNSVVADPLVVLNRNAAGSNAYDIGFVFERGALVNTAFIWDEANDQFALLSTTETGTTQGSINNSGYLDLRIANLVASGTSSTFGNIQIGQNTISSVNTNGNINLTPNGTGEVVAATLSVSDLTSGRFALVGASGSFVDDGGITYSGNNVTFGGNLAVDGGSITTTQTTANIFAANATTINIGASGGNVITGGDLQLGGNDIRESGGNVAITLTNTNVEVVGDLAVTGGDITTSAATATVFNANATTLSVGNAATTLYIGNSAGNVITGGDLQIGGNDIRESGGNVAITLTNTNVEVVGDLAVTDGDITTSAATATVFNANATTLSVGNAATTLYIGNSSGNVLVGGDLQITGNDIRSSTGNVAITLSDIDANIAGNLNVADDLAVNGGDITTTQTTATIFNANATTLSIGNAATTTYIGASGGNIVTGGDIQIGGDSIRSSTGNIAMQLNDKDVTVLGNLTVQGTRTEVGTSDLVVSDSLINLHTPANLAPLTADDGRDIGLVMHYFKGGTDKFAFFGWANDSGELEYYSEGIESNVGTFSGQYGTIKANIYRSEVPTGTAPFIVSSTTQVANLNVAVAGNLVNGNSNVLVYANSNVAISANGVANVAVISYQGANITGWANISGNIDTNGNINTTNTTVGIANANSTTLYIGGDSTATYIGNSAGNVSIAGDIIVGGNDIRESGGNVTITLTNLDVTVAGDLAVNGGDITTDDTTGTIFNANVTTLSIGNAATTTYVGAANGNVIFGSDIQLGGDSIRESGSNIAIQLVNTNVEVTSNLAVNGGDITTTQATANIFNSNVTSLTIGNAATGVFIGNTSNTGTTQISGNLTVTTNIDVIGNADLANLRVQDTTISSVTTNANINIDPNGTGAVVLNSTGDDSNVVIKGNTTSGYNNLIYADAVNGRVGFLTDTVPAGAIFKVNSNSSVILPVGNTATRPNPEVEGMLRYNTTISNYEFWDGSAWQSTGSAFTIISVDAFSGDGSTVAFTLSQNTTTAGVIVAINGIVQQPTTAYNVSGTTLTFTEAPLAGDEIDARVITTTSSVEEIAQGDSSVSVTDTGSNGTVTLTADGVARVVANTAVNITGAIVPITSGTSVGTSATVIDSFDKTIYRSAKYVIQVSHASAGYEVSEVLVVHNGTTATQAQYGVTYTGAASLGATSVGVNGNDIELKYTGVNSANTVKIFKEYIRI